MNRRNILWLFCGCVAAIGLSSCVSHPEFPYREGISSVMVSADEKKLVVLTAKYHYVFDAPPALVSTLKSEFHPFVQASMGTFHVSSNGETSGRLSLRVSGASKQALESAISSGYVQSGNDAVFETLLRGERFRAGKVDVPQQYKLNKSYEILVTSDQKGASTPLSPLQIIGIAPAIAGVTLFGTALLVNCAAHGEFKNCHE